MSDTVNLLAYGTEIIGSADTSGSSGGGHTIEDMSGTAVEQRSVMQFTDAGVEDNDTDGVTEITVIRQKTSQEVALMSDDEKKGLIEVTDLNPRYIPADNAVSVVADGVKTYAQLLTQLYGLVDSDKITRNSKLVMSLTTGDVFYNIERHYSTQITFTKVRNTASDYLVETMWLGTSSAYQLASTGASSTTFTDSSSSVPTSGVTFTLYYNILPSVEVENDYLTVESKTVWPNMTLAANSSTDVKTADISKTGYTPMGVVGWSFDGSYGNCLTYSKMTISGNTLTYLVANNGNNSATANCVVKILYRKG